MDGRAFSPGLTGAAILLAGVAVACGTPGPTPTAPVTTRGGNAVLPLDDGLTWIYRPVGAAADPGLEDPMVQAITGTDTVNGERAWLFEYSVGTTNPARLILVDRSSEVWIVGVELLTDGAWERTLLPVAQRWQLPPGEHEWTTDLTAAPEPWRYRTDWHQTASGTMDWFGESRTAWLLEGNLTFGESSSREVDVLLEGIGSARITAFFAGGDGLRLDLASFAPDPPEIGGVWRGAMDGVELRLDLIAGPTIAVSGAEAAPIRDWVVDEPRVSFTFDRDRRPLTVTTLRVPWGLTGTAVDAAGRSSVIELVRIPDEAAASPGPSR